MRLIIINKHISNSLGGSEVQCDLIARSLLKHGIQVFYIAIGRTSNDIYPYNIINTAFNHKHIMKIINDVVPDCIYWRYDLNQFYSFAFSCKKLNIPIIYSVSHINNLTNRYLLANIFKGSWQYRHFSSKLIELIRNLYNRRGLKLVSGIVTNNSDFLSLSKKYSRHVVYIPNSNLKQNEKYLHKRQYICWVANLKPDKRPELLLSIAESVKDYNIDILVVGDIQNSSYEYFLNSENLPKNLIYLGKRNIDEANRLINGAQFLIHTCLPEGFPGNFIQAWVHGKPVISLSYDPGGIISNYNLGIYAANNFTFFINSIKQLVSEKKKMEYFQSFALSMTNYFNPDLNTSKLLVFIKSILDGTRKN